MDNERGTNAGRGARLRAIALNRQSILGDAHRSTEFAIEAAIRILGLSTIAFVVLIFLFLLREGIPLFFEVPLDSFLGSGWYPTFSSFGVLPLDLGSILVTVNSILVALPLGVATAVFVREVAPAWAREILKLLIEVLGGIPSVVLGFLGMILLAPFILEALGMPTRLTTFAGAFLLAYTALPTIISVTEDALDAVPKNYRDAALAMGRRHGKRSGASRCPRQRRGFSSP